MVNIHVHVCNVNGISVTCLCVLQILALGSVGVGLVFSVLFHFGTKERTGSPLLGGNDANIWVNVNVISTGRMEVSDWLKEPQFYQVGNDLGLPAMCEI